MHRVRQDFKLQGRTLPKLIISIFKRTTPPWMNLASFYVLISRCRTSDSLRLLQYDPEGLNAVCALKHDEYLVAWEHAYDNGRWSDALALAALERVRRERQRAKAARAAEKKEKDAQRTADKRKDAAARRREAKAQAAAEKKAQTAAEEKAKAAADKKAQAEAVAGASAPAAKRQKLSKAPMPTPIAQPRPQQERGDCSTGAWPEQLDDSDLDSD